MAILDNLFGAPPEYLTGLLGQEQTDKLRKQALTTGLVNSAIALIAQPRNQRYGSALPYIGKALMAGQQAGQGVYSNALQGLETQQKLAELKRQQEQRKIYDEGLKNLYTTTPAVTENVPSGYAPAQTQVMEGQVSPNFGMTRLPDVTREVAPARRELNTQALIDLAATGDSRAANLINSIKTAREISAAPKVDLVKLGRGEVAYDPISGQYVAQGLPEQTKPKDYGNELEAQASAEYQGKSFGQLTPFEQQSVINKVEGRRIRVAGAGVPSQAPSFKDAGELRKEYNTLPQIKAFGEVQNAFDQVKTGIDAVSPAGDLAAATKFMKLLDPGSVVRESELGMAMAATGLVDRALAYKDYVLKGTKLSPAQRQDFLGVAQQLYNAAKARKDDIDNQYAGIAQTGGLDPNLVIGNPQTSSGSLQQRIMKIKQQRQGGKK